jgi:hypothetical protein
MNMPASIHERLRKQAFEERRSMSEIVLELLDAQLPK